MGKHLLVFTHVKSNFYSLIFYFAFLLDHSALIVPEMLVHLVHHMNMNTVDGDCTEGLSIFIFILNSIALNYMIFQNKWQFLCFVHHQKSFIHQKKHVISILFHVCAKLGLYIYNFGISFILMQFDHYFMCVLIVESLVCSKHFDLINSQIMMVCFLEKLKSYF